ncbi:hypothetical protein ACOACQ_15490 [Nocardioides sp. CPCC 206347]|jgi:hypothetical protein|uniref:hypothetical protein n=1 Tax=unclassified Nocardioides TaxID=2615069 RepID=UPI003610DD89
MTRDHEHAGAHTAAGPGTQAHRPPAVYSIRQLVAYQRLIERRERVDPAVAVAEYARANPGIDLDARSTFAEWKRSSPLDDTAERPGGFFSQHRR